MRFKSALASSLLLPVVLPLSGCLDHPLKEVVYENSTQKNTVIEEAVRHKVDILFVIDNSGSMGEEQATLAANFDAFIDELEEVDADYRIGITTTDDGNPWCTGTGPEAGALQLRACRDHLEDFVFAPGSNQEVDRTMEACLASCPEELAGLAPEPTTTVDDLEPKPRPWLERERGASNVPAGVTVGQALACWGPQGIAGCGFESPLEAFRKTLLRSVTDGEAGAGFMREDALLQVVFITDEADCSLGPGGDAAFSPDGDRTLWPDPTAAGPPSAVCWNAGVSCATGNNGGTHCVPANIGADGQESDADRAVLQPLSRYIGLLEEVGAAKQKVSSDVSRPVLVSVIAGVPEGYAGEDLDYGPGTDAQFEADFGIGAGCTSGQGEAVPPVRLLALAQVFATDEELETHSNVFSICDNDYTPALRSIADILIGELRPNCIGSCVAGADSIVDGNLSTCVIVHELDGDSERLPTCIQQPSGEWVNPEGATLCAYAVAEDDLDAVCAQEGRNVEIRTVRDPEAIVGSISVACEVSDQPRIDCPSM